MTKKLEELLLDGIQALAGVSPSMFLSIGYESLVKVMQFIEVTPEAAYADKKLRKLFAQLNWALDALQLEAFFQLVGEVQFWMLANGKGVPLERIPETASKTADLRMAGASARLPQFEVKTLSVRGGWNTLKQMAEDSYQAQLELQAQIARGEKVATSFHSIAAHGALTRGKERTEMSHHLIDKAAGNIKAGQYEAAPTFLVLNLMLIDSHFTGPAELRPAVPGYPDDWSVYTGVLWTTGFGTMEQLVHGLPEFEGKPGLEGVLGREGILAHPDYQDVAGLLFVIHPLREEPRVYGLMRESDSSKLEAANPDLLQALFALVGKWWNDNVDSNGWQLTEH